MQELITALLEITKKFFESTLPEQILVWAGETSEGLINIIRNIIEKIG